MMPLDYNPFIGYNVRAVDTTKQSSTKSVKNTRANQQLDVSTLLTGLLFWHDFDDYVNTAVGIQVSDKHGQATNNFGLVAVNAASERVTLAAGEGPGGQDVCYFSSPDSTSQGGLTTGTTQSSYDEPRFDGENNPPDVLSTSWTMACWVRFENLNPDNGTVSQVMCWRGRAASTTPRFCQFNYRESDGAYRFGTFDSANNALFTGVNTGIVADTWYCWIGSYDHVAETLYAYQDNSLSDTLSTAGNTGDYGAGGALLSYGTFGNAGFPINNKFQGWIMSGAIWRRVLTSDERTEFYNGGSGLLYSDL